MTYFDETALKDWTITNAFAHYQQRNQDLNRRQLLQKIHSDLIKKSRTTQNLAISVKAEQWLRMWSKLTDKIPKTPNPVAAQTAAPVLNVSIYAPSGAIVVGGNVEMNINAPSASTAPTESRKRNADAYQLKRDNSFEVHKRRVYVYDYLHGADRIWEPVTSWRLQDLNVTEILVSYRQRTIDLANKKHNLSDNRVLSLNNVFVVTRDQNRSCFHRFAPKYHAAVCNDIRRKNGWSSLPFATRSLCSVLEQKIRSSSTIPTKALRRLLRQFECAADNINGSGEDEDPTNNNNTRHDNSDDNSSDDHTKHDDLIMVSSIISTMIKSFAVWQTNCSYEATFIEQHITPFMQEIFNRHSIFMRRGEPQFVNDRDKLMADYIGSHMTTTGVSHDILVVEISHPGKSSYNELQSDFVKLGKEMKEIINKLLDIGVERPLACGILVKGFAVTTYSMHLKGEDVYIMMEHESVRLLESPEDVHVLPGIIESFVQLKNLLRPTMDRINELAVSSWQLKTLTSWKRVSAEVPERTTDHR